MHGSWSRRELVRVLGVGSSFNIAGCTQKNATTTETPSPSTDYFITDIAGAIDALSFTAMLLEEVSSGHPVQFRVTLRNTADRSLWLRWGRIFFIRRALTSERLDLLWFLRILRPAASGVVGVGSLLRQNLDLGDRHQRDTSAG